MLMMPLIIFFLFFIYFHFSFILLFFSPLML